MERFISCSTDFCYPLTKYFEMSELCNNSACFSVEIKGTSDIWVLSVLWVSSYSQDLLQAAKLGSIKAAKYRVPVAAEAFFAGRSEKVMFCGGKIRDFSGESMTEAEYGG